METNIDKKESISTDIKELTKQMKNALKKRKFDIIEELYRQVLSINPNDVFARSIYMHSLINQKRFDEEQRIYDELMAINSNDLYAKAIHMQALAKQGRFKEEKEVYKEALSIEPQNPHIQESHKTSLDIKRRYIFENKQNVQDVKKDNSDNNPKPEINLLNEAR